MQLETFNTEAQLATLATENKLISSMDEDDDEYDNNQNEEKIRKKQRALRDREHMLLKGKSLIDRKRLLADLES